MKKLLALCMCVMMALGVLAGCGQKDSIAKDLDTVVRAVEDILDENGLELEEQKESEIGTTESHFYKVIENGKKVDFDVDPSLFIDTDIESGKVVRFSIMGAKRSRAANIFKKLLPAVDKKVDPDKLVQQMEGKAGESIGKGGLLYYYNTTQEYYHYVAHISEEES